MAENENSLNIFQIFTTQTDSGWFIVIFRLCWLSRIVSKIPFWLIVLHPKLLLCPYRVTLIGFRAGKDCIMEEIKQWRKKKEEETKKKAEEKVRKEKKESEEEEKDDKEEDKDGGRGGRDEERLRSV